MYMKYMSLLTEKILEANIKRESEPPSPIYIDLFMWMVCTRIGMRSSALLKPRNWLPRLSYCLRNASKKWFLFCSEPKKQLDAKKPKQNGAAKIVAAFVKSNMSWEKPISLIGNGIPTSKQER
ncbi:hypothetical protein CEXT_715831 [Caerostris extrusa]|uniref:Uncharacterized protein n=1 Tax=Caerostris extrusa TaxID=172846 RepID=A0AAV4WJ30_CAEEX|nr:hypothetical protein CEXT_715831 [Caerostris extrusa]